MKKIMFMVLVLVSVFAMGCVTTAPQADTLTSYIGERSAPSKDEIMQYISSVASEQDLWRYTALDSGVVIEETLPQGTEVYKTTIPTQAYFGYNLLNDFNVLDGISVADRAIMIESLLSNYPVETADAQCRSVGVYNWNNTDTAIMLSTVRTEIPEIAAVLVIYPTIYNTLNKDAAQPFLITPDGRIGKSETLFETVTTSFESISDPLGKINLTHDYLTDYDVSNDVLVLPVLEEIINDDTQSALAHLFARAQLFMYYLFASDYSAAREVAIEANEYYTEHKEEDIPPDVVKVITVDIISMLEIAEELNNKK